MNDQQELSQTILEIVSELSAVSRSVIRPQDRLREDLGLDSVSAMELLSMLDERLKLDISIEEAMQVSTVAQVIEMSQRHIAARGS